MLDQTTDHKVIESLCEKSLSNDVNPSKLLEHELMLGVPQLVSVFSRTWPRATNSD